MEGKSSAKAMPWWFWPVMTVVVVFIFILAMGSLLSSGNQSACTQGDFALCALENVVAKIWEDGDCSDIALQNLGIAQLEFIKDRQLSIRDDTEVRFLGLPPLEDLRSWCTVIKHQYQFVEYATVVETQPSGEIVMTEYGERGAVMVGSQLHAYSQAGEFGESRVIRDCNGKLILPNDLSWAFKCPVSQVIVHTDRERNGIWSVQTYNELGLALHDWRLAPNSPNVTHRNN